MADFEIKLDNLTKQLDKLDSALHTGLQNIEAKLDQRLENRDKRVDTLEVRLREVENFQNRQKGLNTLMSVIGGALTSAIVIYIWNLIIK